MKSYMINAEYLTLFELRHCLVPIEKIGKISSFFNYNGQEIFPAYLPNGAAATWMSIFEEFDSRPQLLVTLDTSSEPRDNLPEIYKIIHQITGGIIDMQKDVIYLPTQPTLEEIATHIAQWTIQPEFDFGRTLATPISMHCYNLPDTNYEKWNLPKAKYTVFEDKNG